MTFHRVLIVEDDPFIAIDLEDVLLRAGWHVCGVAASQAEALSVADRTRPTIALVDVRLSPGDGRVVASELVTRYGTAVLMATAHSGDLDALRATGALACLPKPYPMERVPAALEAVLGLRDGILVDEFPDDMLPLKRTA
jgi:DNA-binding response OmpR family regulator